MPQARTDLGYHDARDALRDIWSQRLPIDVRFYVCGMTQAAGRKQGEEIFPERIMEKIADPAVPHLERGELEEMVGKTEHALFQDSRIRDQYIVVILAGTVRYLDENCAHLARNLSGKIRDLAARN